MLLKLDKELKQTDTINYACLPQNRFDTPKPGDMCTIAGWGVHSKNTNISWEKFYITYIRNFYIRIRSKKLVKDFGWSHILFRKKNYQFRPISTHFRPIGKNSQFWNFLKNALWTFTVTSRAQMAFQTPIQFNGHKKPNYLLLPSCGILELSRNFYF